jgi:hypothetical protein
MIAARVLFRFDDDHVLQGEQQKRVADELEIRDYPGHLRENLPRDPDIAGIACQAFINDKQSAYRDHRYYHECCEKAFKFHVSSSGPGMPDPGKACFLNEVCRPLYDDNQKMDEHGKPGRE